MADVVDSADGISLRFQVGRHLVNGQPRGVVASLGTQELVVTIPDTVDPDAVPLIRQLCVAAARGAVAITQRVEARRRRRMRAVPIYGKTVPFNGQ